MSKREQDTKKKLKHISKLLTKKGMVVIICILLVIAVGLGVRLKFSTDSKTTKLGFEDIGELATQSVYCSDVGVIDKSRNLFDIEIPFTQSKYIYSIDSEIKAGIDFTQVDVNVDEARKAILVSMPEVKVLSNSLDLDSLKVYEDSQSAFTKISLQDNNESYVKLQQRAQKDAISNGLMDNAHKNAEVILKGFLGNVYDLKEYKVVFKDK